ncbi:MAG: UDP-N-acetylmuramoyl-L-alanyl-D-glutamate--2,6-diaminopimelate ligase [Synergistales bacterium]|nr:UDP-N-acetylmuramoyl-L-alanyl-D-glutamate--2,6-diaminopimelate ligase [Synergistales bacterium]
MMKLEEIALFLSEHGFLQERRVPGRGEHSPSVAAVAHDHRYVHRDTLFACVRGEHIDGHGFAGEAFQRGASALLCRDILDVPLPQLQTSDTRRVMGLAAAKMFGFPANSLLLIAVTGTNGKTTTSCVLQHILRQAGHICGRIGSLGYHDGLSGHPLAHTTPEGTDLQRMLAEMVDRGCTACVMEASSHALVQGRLAGCLFDGAVVTNVTSEHLDYHGTMEQYFSAKALLVAAHMKPGGKVLANLDNPYSARICHRYPANAKGFSVDARRGAYVLSDSTYSTKGTACSIGTPTGGMPDVFLSLPGMFNAQNLLGAAGLLLELGLEPEVVRHGLASLSPVPGRFECYTTTGGIGCVIDFAHTPDALETILKATRGITAGRILVVFGCGGDRFRAKRPEMARIADALADYIVITNDNPRFEEPAAIAEEIAAGIPEAFQQEKAMILLDRQQAIYTALDVAQRGDTVLLAGKGAEEYIIFGDRRLPHSDRGCLFHWVEQRGEGLQ